MIAVWTSPSDSEMMFLKNFEPKPDQKSDFFLGLSSDKGMV